MHSDPDAEEQICLGVQGRYFVLDHPLKRHQSNPQGSIALRTHEALGESGRSFSSGFFGHSSAGQSLALIELPVKDKQRLVTDADSMNKLIAGPVLV